MKNYKLEKTTGFTLAEVLISLMIIGVITAMTIPNLLNDTKDAQNKIAWKKAWSVINQINLKLMVEDNEIEEDWSSLTLKENFADNLNVIKECNSNATIKGECFTSDNIYHPLDSSYIVSISDYCPAATHECTGLITSDGMHFVFRKDPASNPDFSHAIFVDTNGFKGPNTCGKDILGIIINKPNGKLEPSRMSSQCEDNATEWLRK